MLPLLVGIQSMCRQRQRRLRVSLSSRKVLDVRKTKGMQAPFCPDLGDGHLKTAEQFQEKGFELRIGLVDLINEEHNRFFRSDGLKGVGGQL